MGLTDLTIRNFRNIAALDLELPEAVAVVMDDEAWVRLDMVMVKASSASIVVSPTTGMLMTKLALPPVKLSVTAPVTGVPV